MCKLKGGPSSRASRVRDLDVNTCRRSRHSFRRAQRSGRSILRSRVSFDGLRFENFVDSCGIIASLDSKCYRQVRDHGVIALLLCSDRRVVHFRSHSTRSWRQAGATPGTSDELLQTFPGRTGTLWWRRTGAITGFPVLLGLQWRTFVVPGFGVGSYFFLRTRGKAF